MTKEQIEQKAKNVYMRCFDDDFEYTDVLHALEICAEETATEATRELKTQIEKMKCCREEIIKALKECLDYEWLHAHNGKAKYLYLQSAIDIVNEEFDKEIKENDKRRT